MAVQENPTLHLVDYIVFVIIFLFTVGIGLRYALVGKGSNSKESYFVANRKMHFIPVAVSLLVTFQSSIMMLGLPAEIYVYGIGILIVMCGILVPQIMTAYVSVPLFKPLQITSVFEYLQLRFQSRSIRLCGVFLFILSHLIYMGVVLYAQAVAVEAVMGFNLWLSIFIMDICAVLYTSLGGIKSVIWTDVFQAAVMFMGIIAVIIKGTIETGGTRMVWEHMQTGDRLNLLDFDPDPTVRHTFWTMLFPMMLSAFDYTFSQSTVQRIAASSSESGAKRMSLIAASMSVFIFVLVVYEGAVVYAFFSQQNSEPLTCNFISDPNQILPYAVLILFQNMTGMTGLFIAALFSASLSTISSGFCSMSILVMEDVLQPHLKNKTDAQTTVYAKISVVCIGVCCLLFCVLASALQGPLHQISTSLSASANGPLVGLFFLACFFPSTHTRGAAIGVTIGFLVSCTLTLGSSFSPDVKKTEWLSLGNSTCGDVMINMTSSLVGIISNSSSHSDVLQTATYHPQQSGYNEYFSLSYLLFSPIGIITTIGFGLLFSFILGRNRPGDVNPKYFMEISDSLLIFLPAPVKCWLKQLGPQFKDGWLKRPMKTSPSPVPEMKRFCVVKIASEVPINKI